MLISIWSIIMKRNNRKINRIGTTLITTAVINISPLPIRHNHTFITFLSVRADITLPRLFSSIEYSLDFDVNINSRIA